MTITKLKTGIISAVIVAGVATPLVIRQQTNLRHENDLLRLQIARMSQLVDDNTRLSNRVAQTKEKSSPSAPDSQFNELLRLRGEVGTLRRQTNELAKQLRGENQRLRSSLAAVNQRSRQGTRAETPLETLPKESWSFAGYADPESAFQSAVWASSQGDFKTFLASMSPDGPEYKSAVNDSEQEFIDKIKREYAAITGYKIIDKQVISDSEVILAVYATGKNESVRVKLQRYGADWKLAGPVKDPPGS